MDQKMMAQELREIVEKNKNLRGDILSGKASWSASYNKKTDMLIVGGTFPEGTYYFPIDDGFMLRIDDSKRIYGCAIENAKWFIKKHPEASIAILPIVHPVRGLLQYLLLAGTIRGLDTIKSILSVIDNLAATKIAYSYS